MKNCNTAASVSKLKRPLEGGDTETIFAALSGTFDQAFEVFFSSLGATLSVPNRFSVTFCQELSSTPSLAMRLQSGENLIH